MEMVSNNGGLTFFINASAPCQDSSNVVTDLFSLLFSILPLARAYQQMGDSSKLIDQAIAVCPVNCIYRLDFEKLNGKSQ